MSADVDIQSVMHVSIKFGHRLSKKFPKLTEPAANEPEGRSRYCAVPLPFIAASLCYGPRLKATANPQGSDSKRILNRCQQLYTRGDTIRATRGHNQLEVQLVVGLLHSTAEVRGVVDIHT